MGYNIPTQRAISDARAYIGLDNASRNVTQKAQEEVRRTGRLNEIVDPAKHGIRRSLPRFEVVEKSEDLILPNDMTEAYRVTVGLPLPVEILLDTTGSMGENVDIAMSCLPDTFGLMLDVLPENYDLQMSIGIFGDYTDDFILNVPQFEMEASKIVNYLTLMNPEHCGGGNGGEDPQYGAFAAAYLTDLHVNKLGLKGYHFIVTDEPTHTHISAENLERVFSKKVWDWLKEQGHPEITPENLPTCKEVYEELQRKFHAFVILVDGYDSNAALASWCSFYGERIIQISDTSKLPAIQAAIIGYNEETIEAIDLEKYLREHDVRAAEDIAAQISRSMPFGAQVELKEKSEFHLPIPGDIYLRKTDLRPYTHVDTVSDDEDEDVNWL